jgi:hypothetical protein
MPENYKTEELIQKLTPCIQRGELEKCVEEAARIVGEIGIGAEKLLDLSSKAGASGRHDLDYVLAIAAAQGLEGIEKAEAYCNAGLAAQFLKNVQKAEKHYQDAIKSLSEKSGCSERYPCTCKM